MAVIVLLADISSKYLAHQYLPYMKYSYWYPYGGIPVFKNFYGIEFSIVHTINKGAAWGILADWQTPLLYFRILLIASLMIYALFFNKNRSYTYPLALIIAGAIGNVLDFFFYGHVIDMFHFILWGYDYPVFNLADTAIFVGIAWLFLLSFFKSPHKLKCSVL